VIGAVRAPAEGQRRYLEASSGSWWQCHGFSREQAMSGRPAHRNTCAGAGAAVIAAATPMAVAGPSVAGIGRDGHLRCHHAALDEGQAHPEPQQNRQEQNSNAMPGPAFHRAPNMARSNGISKSPSSHSFSSPDGAGLGRRAIRLPRSWKSRRRRRGIRGQGRPRTAPPCPRNATSGRIDQRWRLQ
jgi:hypothetical protein